MANMDVLNKRLGPVTAEPKPAWWEIDFTKDALIEASAGTGKTYTLENLVLRLVCEKKYDPKSLLLVTFTEKAAGELKERIVKVLKTVEPERTDLDEMTICTIHSFCREVLADYPFETGLQMETEVSTSDQALIERAVHNVMTREKYAARFADENQFIDKVRGWNQEKDIAQLAEVSGRILGQVLSTSPDVSEVKSDSAVEDAMKVFCGVCDALPHEGAGRPGQYVMTHTNGGQTFRKRQDWNRGQYNFFSSLDEDIRLATDERSAIATRVCALEVLEKGKIDFKLHAWDGKVIEKVFCEREGFEAYKGLASAASSLKECLQEIFPREIANEALPEFRRLKSLAKSVTFDDMILETSRVVADAAACVDDPVKQAFLRNIRSRYRIALVDEFQDTDVRQWTIFRNLFSHAVNVVDGCTPKDGCLIVVGDPKQAIYSFRGADVAMYLQARKAIQSDGTICELGVMYRSTQKMIDAFNAIFKADDWFTNMKAGSEAITYGKEVAFPDKPKDDVKDFRYPEAEGPVTLLESLPENGGEGNKGKCLPLFMANAADEMWRLHDATDNWPRKLPWREMCVLVRSGPDGDVAQRVLRKKKIPCRRYKETGLFDSAEAESILALFDYLIKPSTGNLAAVLLTPFFNVPLWGLDARMKAVGAAFTALCNRWQKRIEDREWGRLFESFLVDTAFGQAPCGDRSAFLRTRAGIQQILDRLLEANGTARDLAAFADMLRAWGKDDETAGEKGSVRNLESEDDAVQIMTMHAAKGLEFGAVFVPWGFGEIVSPKLEPNKALRFEQEIEMRRVLYVALTRAKYKLYLPWSRQANIDAGFGSKKSALKGGFLQKGIKALFGDNAANVVKGANKPVSSDGGATLGTIWTGQEEGSKDLPPARGMKGWRFKWDSFSSLNHHGKAKTNGEKKEFASLVPKGALSGTVFHEVMEVLCGNPDGDAKHPGFDIGLCDDFEKLVNEDDGTKSPLLEIVRRRMAANGLRNKIGEGKATTARALARMAWVALRTPVVMGNESFNLCEMPADSRRAEVNFVLGEGELLANQAREGALNGSIDLLIKRADGYYILDWKTNFLEGYDEASVNNAMDEAGYHLQYGIYTLAAEKWLGEKTVRGAAYLFVRGGETGDACGVFSRPIDDGKRAEFRTKFSNRVDVSDAEEDQNDKDNV